MNPRKHRQMEASFRKKHLHAGSFDLGSGVWRLLWDCVQEFSSQAPSHKALRKAACMFHKPINTGPDPSMSPTGRNGSPPTTTIVVMVIIMMKLLQSCKKEYICDDEP